MDFTVKAEQLNQKLSTLSADNKLKNTRIICGNYNDIANHLSRSFPQAKVLVLSTEKTFEERGKEIIEQLERAGIKPVNVILSEEEPLSVEGICGLMNAPEDVRVVIVLDYSLFDTALYFCAIKKVHLVEVLHKFVPKRIMANSLLIKNGNDVDLFVADVERTVVIYEGAISSDVMPNTLAYVLSKILSLTDYRVMGVVMRQPLFPEAFNLARQAVLGTLKEVGKSEFSLCDLIYNAFLLEIADNLTKGKLISFSAPSLAEYIYNGKFAGDSGVELLCANVGLDCYSALFSGQYDKTNMPINYYSRSKKLSLTSGILEDSILSTYKMQGNRFAMRKAKINQLFLDLKAELISENKLYNAVVDKYILLGGKKDYDVDKLSHAIMLSGDTPFSVNGMSLVRENNVSNYSI
ncbi:MAG: hypothetical protein IJC07_05490 [Clostridia bacterium]|nr:hypothetical protein [Clostridia bacterium]